MFKKKTAEVVAPIVAEDSPDEPSIAAQHDPIATLKDLQKVVDAARATASEAFQRQAVHERDMADCRGRVAAEASAAASLAEIEASSIMDAGSVSTAELEAAREAVQRAGANAAQARPRMAALERVIDRVRADREMKDRAVTEAVTERDDATEAWLRTYMREAFDLWDRGHALMAAGSALWNAVDAMIDRIKPPAAQRMTFTGEKFVFAEMPSGPDAAPFRVPSRSFPDSRAGRRDLVVERKAIEREQERLRRVLLDVGIGV